MRVRYEIGREEMGREEMGREEMRREEMRVEKIRAPELMMRSWKVEFSVFISLPRLTLT